MRRSSSSDRRLKVHLPMYLLCAFAVLLVGCSANRLVPEEHSYLDGGLMFNLPKEWKADVEDNDWEYRVVVGNSWAEVEYLSGNLSSMPSGVMGFIKLENSDLDDVNDNPERIPVTYLSEYGFIAALSYEEAIQNARNLEFTEVDVGDYSAAKRVEGATVRFFDVSSHDVVMTEVAFLADDIVVDMFFMVEGVEYERHEATIDAIIESVRVDNERISRQAEFKIVGNAEDLLYAFENDDLEEARTYICPEKQSESSSLFASLKDADFYLSSCDADGDKAKCRLFRSGEDDLEAIPFK